MIERSKNSIRKHYYFYYCYYGLQGVSMSVSQTFMKVNKQKAGKLEQLEVFSN